MCSLSLVRRCETRLEVSNHLLVITVCAQLVYNSASLCAKSLDLTCIARAINRIAPPVGISPCNQRNSRYESMPATRMSPYPRVITTTHVNRLLGTPRVIKCFTCRYRSPAASSFMMAATQGSAYASRLLEFLAGGKSSFLTKKKGGGRETHSYSGSHWSATPWQHCT